MKHAAAVSLVLFLGLITGSGALLAQSSGQNANQLAAQVAKQLAAARAAMAGGVNCPIDMQAQRQMGEGTMLGLHDAPQKGIAQTLHLTLNNPRYAEITDVQITVHGLNAKGRVTPTQATPADSSEITKTLDLKIKVGPKEEASTEIVLPAFTSVSFLSLDSVSYADGSAWHSSASESCRAVPDGAMLIRSR